MDADRDRQLGEVLTHSVMRANELAFAFSSAWASSLIPKIDSSQPVTGCQPVTGL
jgi:hypothetical protein